MTFLARAHILMARTGRPFREICSRQGRNGGLATAAKHRRERAQQEAAQAEKRRQVACGTESPDALPEPFTTSDRRNIRREALSAPARIDSILNPGKNS